MITQHAFAAALLDPAAAIPEGLRDPQGRPAAARFDVYRNNVVASLSRALDEGFPAVRALVGPEFFAAMAGVAVRAHPPRDPRMMYYGAEFPDFLARFPPVAHLPYLPDVARIELALRASYHAADHVALTPEELGAIPPDALETARFPIAPSARLLALATPALSVWRRTRDPAAPIPPGPQDVLVARPGFDPEPHLLPPGGLACLTALADGQTLAEAAAAGTAAAPEFDLSALLALALATRILCPTEVP